MPINPNSLSGSADKLTLAFAPSNSTPTVEGHTDATNQLSAVLNGVDDAIGLKQNIASVPVTFPSTWYWSGGGAGQSYAPDSFYAKSVSVAADRYTILSPTAMQIDIDGESYTLTSQATLDLSQSSAWDTVSGTDYRTASNRIGKDFYIYACQNTLSSPLLIVSVNASYPSGTNPNTGIAYSAANTRKIGGFHCLCASMSTPGTRANSTAYALGATILSGSYWYRCAVAGTSAASPPALTTTIDATTTDGGVTWVCEPIHSASGYLAGDIIPNSVWDLNHRASSNNEGMAFVAAEDVWVDIYLLSGTLGTTASVYNAHYTHDTTWNQFVDYCGSVKKKLLRDSTFQVASSGSNEKTNNAGSAEPNTTGGHTDTAGRRMISNYFLEDCTGALWQWLDEQSFQPGSGVAGLKTTIGTKGDIYLMADNADVKLLAGGAWGDGSSCGSRSRAASHCRWSAYSYIGCRSFARTIRR